MTTEEENIWMDLPLPSEVQSEILIVPVIEDWSTTIPRSGAITFEKEYVAGVCIGWKLE